MFFFFSSFFQKLHAASYGFGQFIEKGAAGALARKFSRILFLRTTTMEAVLQVSAVGALGGRLRLGARHAAQAVFMLQRLSGVFNASAQEQHVSFFFELAACSPCLCFGRIIAQSGVPVDFSVFCWHRLYSFGLKFEDSLFFFSSGFRPDI